MPSLVKEAFRIWKWRFTTLLDLIKSEAKRQASQGLGETHAGGNGGGGASNQ